MLSGHSKPPKYYTILSIDGDSMGKRYAALTIRKGIKRARSYQHLQNMCMRQSKADIMAMLYIMAGDEGMILSPLSETMIS